MQKDIQEHFDKVHNEMAQLKETMSQVTGPSHTEGETKASESPGPSHTEGKYQDKSSQRNRLLLQKGASASLLIQVSSLERNNCFVNGRLSITVVPPVI